MSNLHRTKHTHTEKAYSGFDAAYSFFNAELFGGKLPLCLITLRKHKGALGYFADQAFKVGNLHTDEISLNPATFGERTIEQVLSTLVHEMAHLWQYRFGKPSRSGYHNKEWANKMKEVGLHPSTTGAIGGKETGAKCSHYIVTDGAFQKACTKFLKNNQVALYQDVWNTKKAAVKAASKTKYTCPGCEANIWAKPGIAAMCIDCDELFIYAA